MLALLHDVPIAHDQDHIRIADGGEAVRYDEAGATVHQFFHGALNEHFGTGVDRAGSFVQDQDLRVCQHSASDGQ